MPIYSFRTEDGRELEHFFPMGQAPHLGQWTTIEGVECQRVIEPPQLANDKGGMHTGPIVSEGAPSRRQVEGWEREARKFGLPKPARAPGYDEQGRAVFRSESELREYAKRDGRFVVANPSEIYQDAARAPARHEAKVKNTLAGIERELSYPEVV